ncbi:MAG: LysR family transcriptional regulator [Deltaproteobacteria bacterium]|nr:LysR family transcriptional regulator [Deltaproteobacteria bacterium]
MNFAQLRAFAAVATHGGFSAAARAIGVTQPALTHQVRALEAHYGVTLFLRQGRRVVVTPLAEDLLRLARRLNSVADDADALLAAAGGLQTGALRIAADGPYHVVPVIVRLRATHPGLALTVTVGNSAIAEQRLLDVASDVAILAQSSDDERLYARRIAKHPIVAFVARRHPWAKARRVRPEELHQAPMVMREPGSATRQAFDAWTKRRGVQPKAVLEIESREAVREAVAAGLGFGVVSLPELGADERVTAVEIHEAALFTEEHAVCLADRRKDRAIKAFFEAAIG